MRPPKRGVRPALTALVAAVVVHDWTRGMAGLAPCGGEGARAHGGSWRRARGGAGSPPRGPPPQPTLFSATAVPETWIEPP